MTDFDVIFVGGGLSATLAVIALLDRCQAGRKPLRVAVVERGSRLGGNHTWCFHAADLPPGAASLVEPMVVKRWPGYAVQFPRRTRRVASAYACISSERLDEVGCARIASTDECALLLDTVVAEIGATEVTLADGRTLHAPLVIDARGPQLARGARSETSCGYQKFVGLELQVDPGHALSEPVMFDACIPQRDGFRFMYVLPLAPERVLIEETYFSDRPQLDHEQSRREILSYARELRLSVQGSLREEHGVLPMPWRDESFDVHARPLRAGYRGGLFHPVTGYSFPLAIRFALALAASDLTQLSDSPLSAFADAQRAQRPFLHLLSRMMFGCFAETERAGVLEHFYRLPQELIERFYAAELSRWDRARILFGAPPRGFSIARAFRLSTTGVAS